MLMVFKVAPFLGRLWYIPGPNHCREAAIWMSLAAGHGLSTQVIPDADGGRSGQPIPVDAGREGLGGNGGAAGPIDGLYW